jgi:hypothetical protein
MALFSSDTPGRPTYGAGPRPLSTTGLCADLDESRDLEQHKERPSDLVQAASALPKSR